MSLLSKLLNFFKCDTQGTPQPALQEVKVVQLETAEKAPEKAPAKKVSKPRQPKPAAMTAEKPATKKPAATKSKAKASK